MNWFPTREERSPIQLQNGSSRSDVAFAANRERLATAGSDSSVRIRDAMSGQETHKWMQSAVKCLAFSPDGEWLASGGGPPKKPGEVKFWDATTGMETFTLKGYSFISMVFSSDSKRLMSASSNGLIRLWVVTP